MTEWQILAGFFMRFTDIFRKFSEDWNPDFLFIPAQDICVSLRYESVDNR